jgi:hypothetical protein
MAQEAKLPCTTRIWAPLRSGTEKDDEAMGLLLNTPGLWSVAEIEREIGDRARLWIASPTLPAADSSTGSTGLSSRHGRHDWLARYLRARSGSERSLASWRDRPSLSVSA